jgi:hypothetical protein
MYYICMERFYRPWQMFSKRYFVPHGAKKIPPTSLQVLYWQTKFDLHVPLIIIFSVIRLWKTLPVDVRDSPSLDSFSIKIKDLYCSKKNPLFSMNTGSVKDTRLMTRLRMGLSGLNGHRNRYNVIDHSRCPNCNYQNENLDHYFWSCPEYATLRNKLF